MPKPFLKWAGSKHRIAAALKKSLPKGHRLVEPFVGSGAVFLANLGRYKSFLAADTNADLIHVYRCLQDEGETFVNACAEMFCPETNTEESFYALRTEFNESTDPRRRAVLFIYLNRHCFNGLFRRNRSGGFNVPFGRYKAPYFPRKEMLEFREAAKDVEFVVADFMETMDRAGPGDVVYCDPPYVPLSATASFTDYGTAGFGAQEQQALADAAHAVTRRGGVVVLSNHDTPVTRAIYQGAHIRELEVRRSISGQAKGRGRAPELLALFDGRRDAVRLATNQLLLGI